MHPTMLLTRLAAHEVLIMLSTDSHVAYWVILQASWTCWFGCYTSLKVLRCLQSYLLAHDHVVSPYLLMLRQRQSVA